MSGRVLSSERQQSLYYHLVSNLTMGQGILGKVRDFQLPAPASDSPVVGDNLASQFIFVRDIIWLLLLIIPSILLAVFEKFVPKPKKDVKGKVVLITGAGGGIGRKLCLRFAKLGSKVICVDLAKEANNETLRQVKEATGGSDSVAWVCDISDPEDVKKLAEDVDKTYNQIDILIHGAAILAANSILGPSDQFVKKVIDVNFISSFWIVRAFLPSMKKRREGQIVIINSVAGFVPLAYNTLYTSTKAALRGFTDSLTEEFQTSEETKNIKITSIHPSFIQTFKDIKEFNNSRFSTDSSLFLDPDEAARQMVVGIRREYDKFIVPHVQCGLTFLQILTLLPTRYWRMVRDCMYLRPVIPEGSGFILATNEVNKID